MAAYNASVRKALSSQQEDLIDHKEHCSADPEKLATVGRALGHQVRIKRNSSQYGLYTVSEVRQENPDNIVRMGENGRERLGTGKAFTCTLDSQVPHPIFTDEQQARDHDEFIEQLEDNGRHTGLIVIAPHGGDIEQYTDLQAERIASRLAAKGVSAWRCKGWKQGGGAFDRWHITSTDIHEASFPGLDSVISRGFTYAVAFHGFEAKEGEPDIIIGGAAPDSLKEEIKAAIEGAIAGSGITVRIARPDEDFNGDSLQNIVNRLTAGGANGIQIEQSLRARLSQGQAIADAVTNAYNSKITQEPGTIEPKTPRDGILEQYVVLKATLAGPIEKIELSNEQITLADGSKKTILEKDTAGTVTKINFLTNPLNFFAPMPPIVEWKLPDPQPLVGVLDTDPLPGTDQPCREEECLNVVPENAQDVSRSLLAQE
jgi:phage replication-related protein YjqB (UPF0714/DUF867 family)